jgi:2C-methyl-D-erythritol 2,4-cyclodiphosphate synthase
LDEIELYYCLTHPDIIILHASPQKILSVKNCIDIVIGNPENNKQYKQWESACFLDACYNVNTLFEKIEKMAADENT